ncbi:ATP-binding protein [Streptomyces sp. NPDC056121]|uniref:ATP-binding protein n=1 Tax=Streptomyces TaxID=1883 RepID=UPI001D0AC37C|nr:MULTISPECIES: ATP-binding protein [Streptomyces]MCX5083674.1 ATP-binding protein [Streptomyces sp. NBC_00401]UDM01737.1 ATP-binding protein [Streptomyces longhuiensis]
MKQSAVKTLGVAALGAAFAAAGAGAASAAPALPDAGSALNTVTGTLPAEKVAQVLPAGTESLTAGKNAAAGGLNAALPAVQKALPTDGSSPVSGLLGGLPVKSLPAGGALPVG